MKPKMNLIASATSYTIPSMINSAEASLVNEMSKNCGGAGSGNVSNCPQLPRYFHSSQVSTLNRKYVDQCLSEGGMVKLPKDIRFESYPSFIPPSTVPGGCTTMPSFSMSNTIFSYVQTASVQGCKSTVLDFQTWILGYIGTSPYGIPEPKASKIWDMGNAIPRKGCSTVAGSDYAWIGCTLKYWEDKRDYLITGINQIYIGYQDIYGNRREWILNENSIGFDRKYNSLSFSVGSGMILDGKVYFLVYGPLQDNENVDVYCKPINCLSHTQEECNNAARNKEAGGKQIVNGVLEFADTPNTTPKISVTTISPKWNWQGSEGRFFYDESTKKIIVYTKSSGWHAHLQIGWLLEEFPVWVTWVPHKTISRPGASPCGNYSACPHNCLTGVYNDFFPLTSDASVVVGVSLLDATDYINPYLISTTVDTITGMHKIYNYDRKARYTTTTCFSYEIDIWCLSIVEVAMSNREDYLPLPFLYKMDVSCTRDTWWSRIRNHEYITSLFPIAKKDKNNSQT
ncbi:attachment glycoprotein [Wufeng Murina leucogaster paramyxovirus 1]|nr:attachment glycoprotein [Wufeng Murina leucogaster paramyxovirus 1]